MECRILFISFCDPAKKLHRLWIKEWCEKYGVPLLLDPDRKAYRAWGLKSSLLASWGLANTWYYLKAMFGRGDRFNGVKGDDSAQLGADFVVAPAGSIVLSHYCRDPTDRVSVDEIPQAVHHSK